MPRARSLFQHLLAWALAALCVVWLCFVVVGYRTGVEEADELTDGHLASVATLLLRQGHYEFMPDTGVHPLGETELRAHDYQQSLSVLVWDHAGRVVTRTGSAPTPAFTEDEGFDTLALGPHAQPWRSFARWSQPGQHYKIMVLLSMAERDALVGDIAQQVAEPGLWLLPVVGLLLTLAIRRGLRPLNALGQQVMALDVHRDKSLQHAPPHDEFRAIVAAINTLMARYDSALERERALASEIAHELRTPLASLQLHTAALQGPLSPDERAEVLRRLEADGTRASKVLADVLALARASRTELAQAAQAVDLCALARRVTVDYAQIADRAGRELSFEAPGPCEVTGHPVLLELALRNLIDNALAHTPKGTAVEVRVLCDPAGFEVRDHGRAAGDSARSPHGLGLGQQLVRRVASIHGGTLERIDDADPGLTCWRVRLSAPAA